MSSIGDGTSATWATHLQGIYAALYHDDSSVRLIAIKSLGRMGEHGIFAASRLASMAREDPARELRVTAFNAMVAIGPRTLPWLLSSTATACRPIAVLPVVSEGLAECAERAMQALGLLPDQRIPRVMQLIEDFDVAVRHQALLVLSDVLEGKIAAPYVKLNDKTVSAARMAVYSALKDRDDFICLQAGNLLCRLFYDNSAAGIAEFIARDPKHPCREFGEQLLRTMGKRLPRTYGGVGSGSLESALSRSPLEVIVEKLVEDLSNGVPDKQSNVVYDLEEFARRGFIPDAVINGLLQSLREPTSLNRISILEILNRVSHYRRDVREQIIRFLDDEDPRLRSIALACAAELRPIPPGLTERLVDGLFDSDSRVRNQSARLLKEFAERLRPFTERIKAAMTTTPDPSLKEQLEELLNECQSRLKGRAISIAEVDGICERLRNADPTIRKAAVAETAYRGNTAPKIVVGLIQMLITETTADVSDAAQLALRRIGSVALPAVVATLKQSDYEGEFHLGDFHLPIPELFSLLESSNPRLRRAAIEELRTRSSTASAKNFANEYGDRILGMLHYLAPEERNWVTYFTYRMTPTSEQAKAMLKLAESSECEMSVVGYKILAQWSAFAGIVVPRMVDQLVEQGCEESARSVLSDYLGPYYANLMLIQRRRGSVPEALLKPLSSEAVPYLCHCLEDADPELRHSAACVLGELQDEATSAIRALIRCIKDVRVNQEDPELSRKSANEARDAAIEALGKIGPAAREAVATLTELYLEADESLERVIEEALLRIQTENLEDLSNRSVNERWRQGWILWERDIRRNEVQRVLLEAARNPELSVDSESKLAFLNHLEVDAPLVEMFLGHEREAAQEGLDRCVEAEQRFWCERLSLPAERNRTEAVRRIGEFVPHAWEAPWPEGLELAIQDPKPSVRSAAATTLGRRALAFARFCDYAESSQESLTKLIVPLAQLLVDPAPLVAASAREAVESLWIAASDSPDRLADHIPANTKGASEFREARKILSPTRASAAGLTEADQLDREEERLMRKELRRRREQR